MNKNLWLLILSQIFAFTAAPVTVFLSGIIGSQFSPVKSLATLPMALSIVGIAIFAIFAAKVMSIIGRRAGFIFASIISSLSSLLAAYSIIIESFILFNLACFLLGAGVAFFTTLIDTSWIPSFLASLGTLWCNIGPSSIPFVIWWNVAPA